MITITKTWLFDIMMVRILYYTIVVVLCTTKCGVIVYMSYNCISTMQLCEEPK